MKRHVKCTRNAAIFNQSCIPIIIEYFLKKHTKCRITEELAWTKVRELPTSSSLQRSRLHEREVIPVSTSVSSVGRAWFNIWIIVIDSHEQVGCQQGGWWWFRVRIGCFVLLVCEWTGWVTGSFEAMELGAGGAQGWTYRLCRTFCHISTGRFCSLPVLLLYSHMPLFKGLWCLFIKDGFLHMWTHLQFQRTISGQRSLDTINHNTNIVRSIFLNF